MDKDTTKLIFYESWFKSLDSLDDSIQLQLYQAITRYAFLEQVPELNPMLMFGFNEIRTRIDMDKAKYEDVRLKRSEAGKKHKGNQHSKSKKTNESFVEQNGTNGTSVPFDKQNGTNGTISISKSISKDNNLNLTIKEKYKKKYGWDLNFVDDAWDDILDQWLEYKRERKESYKSITPVKAFYNKLQKFSNNNLDVAKAIIEQSFANNWAGIFELKNQTNIRPQVQVETQPPRETNLTPVQRKQLNDKLYNDWCITNGENPDSRETYQEYRNQINKGLIKEY